MNILTPESQAKIRHIIGAVSYMSGVPESWITGEARQPDTVAARHFAMYCARVLTDASLPVIGREFGGKHHTSVLYAVRQVGKLKVEKKVERVRKAVKA